jgi:hypothetical protein
MRGGPRNRSFSPCDNCTGKEALSDVGTLVKIDFRSAVKSVAGQIGSRSLEDHPVLLEQEVNRAAKLSDLPEHLIPHVLPCAQMLVRQECEAMLHQTTIQVNPSFI